MNSQYYISGMQLDATWLFLHQNRSHHLLFIPLQGVNPLPFPFCQ